MIRYRTLGHGAPDQLSRLTENLRRHGAEEAADRDADLLLVAADTVADAAALLRPLTTAERSRALLVGTGGDIDIRQPATDGTLAWLLELYRPLGAIAVAAEWRPTLAGFIGSKELAEQMDAGFAKQFSSAHYGAWLRCEGADAAAFLLRMLAAREPE